AMPRRMNDPPVAAVDQQMISVLQGHVGTRPRPVLPTDLLRIELGRARSIAVALLHHPDERERIGHVGDFLAVDEQPRAGGGEHRRVSPAWSVWQWVLTTVVTQVGERPSSRREGRITVSGVPGRPVSTITPSSSPRIATVS